MDRFINNSEFNRGVIFNHMSKIVSKIEEEQEKDEKDRDIAKEKKLLYAQMIQGLKLNTIGGNRFLYF